MTIKVTSRDVPDSNSPEMDCANHVCIPEVEECEPDLGRKRFQDEADNIAKRQCLPVASTSEYSEAYYQYLQALYAYYAQLGYVPLMSPDSCKLSPTTCATSPCSTPQSTNWTPTKDEYIAMVQHYDGRPELVYSQYLPVNEKDVKVTEWKKGAAREGPMQRKSFLRDRKYFTEEAKDVFRKWLINHIHYPYPTKGEKQKLCDESGLTLRQVDNWFTNTRKRHWKRIIKEWEEQHLDTLPFQALHALPYSESPSGEQEGA